MLSSIVNEVQPGSGPNPPGRVRSRGLDERENMANVCLGRSETAMFVATEMCLLNCSP
jgi:hypothetical protein